MWTKENKQSFTVLLSLSSRAPQMNLCVLIIFKSPMLNNSDCSVRKCLLIYVSLYAMQKLHCRKSGNSKIQSLYTYIVGHNPGPWTKWLFLTFLSRHGHPSERAVPTSPWAKHHRYQAPQLDHCIFICSVYSIFMAGCRILDKWISWI